MTTLFSSKKTSRILLGTLFLILLIVCLLNVAQSLPIISVCILVIVVFCIFCFWQNEKQWKSLKIGGIYDAKLSLEHKKKPITFQEANKILQLEGLKITFSGALIIRHEDTDHIGKIRVANGWIVLSRGEVIAIINNCTITVYEPSENLVS